MSDLILGMGEVGSALYELLTERKIDVEGFDADDTKCKLSMTEAIICNGMMHVCIPYNVTFVSDVVQATFEYNPKVIIIHSTIPSGTCSEITRAIEGKIPLFYSPIRGVRERLLQDLKLYDKFIAPHRPSFEDELKVRFGEIAWYESVASLELAKIMETTYYGFLIAFRKDIDEKFADMKLDSQIFWEFCFEVHLHLGTRPVMVNDGEKIGGHGVINNLDLLPKELSFYKEWIGKWKT